MAKRLLDRIKELPQKPGVYVYKNAAGTVIYVGKAVNLKNRVSSYFRKDGGNDSVRIRQMISQIADLDYTVTDNEVESLVLENNFIKQFQPKYNVRMRDDKNYLFIKINVKDEIPTIDYDRKPTDKNAKYFGPYTSSQSIRDTLRMLRRIFPYCANTKVGAKPCFYYHIHKCPGVCVGKISLEDYRKNYIHKIIRFLEGRQYEIISDLQKQMRSAAEKKQFEKAAAARNQIYAINRVLERQKLVYAKNVCQDVFALHSDGVASINLFMIREGKLTQKENFIVENTKQTSEQEIWESFLERYYLDATNLPKEILLPQKINSLGLEKLFAARSQRPPKILTPSRGARVELINLSRENAKQYLESQSDKHLLEEAKLLSALKELQRVLKLKELPARIEAFDISNIQGTNAVGSMTVFNFGRSDKSEYRKFKIKTKSTPDDFAMMQELLTRRFARSLQPETSNQQPATAWPLPDLVVIDGGKGQLNTACKVAQHYKLKLPMIGLAKRLEEIFLPKLLNPLRLPANSIALFLLQRIRDEAHRFAITYHRKLRSKSALNSVLDQILGIGPNRKQKLLKQFGSVSKIREASLSELSRIVGSKAAQKIKASV